MLRILDTELRLVMEPRGNPEHGEQSVRESDARKAIDGNRNFGFPYCVLALASARLGRPDDATEAARQLARVAPQFRLGSLRRIRFADTSRLQSDLELLGEAQITDPT